MKKQIFTLSLLTLAALSAQAQITIDQSSYTSWTPRTDTFGRLHTSLPASTSVNSSNDLSAVTYDSVYTRAYTGFTSTTFPNASYTIPFVDGIPSSINNGLGWRSNGVRGNTSVGIQTFGETMIRQSYAIVALGNPADSFIVPAQNVVYSTPRTVLKFPATYGTTWTNNYTYTINFGLTLTAYALNNAPTARITTASEVDSVTGWGKLKVKRADGTASDNFDVLAVKSRVSFRDSLTLNGAPASAGMLMGFGFTQNAVTKANVVNYYRAGEVAPLLSISFDTTFSNPNSGEAHLSRTAAPNGVYAMPAQNNNIRFHPNPVDATGILNVELTENTNGTWTYQLVDAVGRVVTSGNLDFNSSKSAINLTNSGASGLNYIRLNKDGKTEVMKLVMIAH